MVETFPEIDGAAPGIQQVIDRSNTALQGSGGTLTGIAAVDGDFLHALFGSFPYILTLVLLLTLIPLTRAFRSVVLALKAVVLNLASLGAAFGIVVLVFQQGHGSALWGVTATLTSSRFAPLLVGRFGARCLPTMTGCTNSTATCCASVAPAPFPNASSRSPQRAAARSARP